MHPPITPSIEFPVAPLSRVRHRDARMPAAFPIRWQIDWRLESARQRLAVALIISIVLHGLAYTGWRTGPATMAFFKEAFERVVRKNFSELRPEFKPPPPKREVPMVFVEVDPAHAAPEPPKETKNYSTDHSLAANPEPKKLDVPKIDGSQTHVLRTMDVAKPQPKPLEPKPPDPKPAESKEPEVKPKAAPPLGDLAMNRDVPKMLVPSTKPEGEQPVEKPRPKPRTLAEVEARNPTLAGEKMQQEGGVTQRAHVAMLDARRSPFGNYDRDLIIMVQNRWYQLLEDNRYMLDKRGKVALNFRIYFDGRISQMEVSENSVGDMLGLFCQKAILDPAPFPKWPKEMRQVVGTDYREVKFTFWYD